PAGSTWGRGATRGWCGPPPVFEPAAGDELVFVPEADALVALAAADGTETWRAPLDEPLVVRPVWDNGWLIAVSKSGTVRAFRAVDGRLVWQRELSSPAHA